MEEGGKALASLIQRADTRTGPYSPSSEINEMSKVFGEVARQWVRDPGKVVEAQTELARGYLDVWNNALQRMMGEHVEPVAKPEPGDARFRDPEWSSNPYFDFWKQAYLVTSQWAEKVLDETEGCDERTRQRAEYYLRQVAERALALQFPDDQSRRSCARPSRRTARTSCAACSNCSRTCEVAGDLLQDQPDRCVGLRGRQESRHHAGQGRLAERCAPAHPVHADDRQGARGPAADRAAVDQQVLHPGSDAAEVASSGTSSSQGFTVFVVSWVNPDQRLAHKTFEDYMNEGILSATDAVLRETGVKQDQRARLLRRRHAARVHARL